jgi:hypothetical protein
MDLPQVPMANDTTLEALGRETCAQVAKSTYGAMPLAERTLVKWLQANPQRFGRHVTVRNDGGEPCDWFIYLNNVAIGVALYRRGRKLVLHGITRRDNPATRQVDLIRWRDLTDEQKASNDYVQLPAAFDRDNYVMAALRSSCLAAMPELFCGTCGYARAVNGVCYRCCPMPVSQD